MRTLFAAILAAAVGLGSFGTADAQLWQPKKKPAAVTTAKKKPRAVARKKKPVRKPVVEAVAARPSPDDDRDVGDRDSDRDRDRDDDVDDRPRISVVDGDG